MQRVWQSGSLNNAEASLFSTLSEAVEALRRPVFDVMECKERFGFETAIANVRPRPSGTTQDRRYAVY